MAEGRSLGRSYGYSRPYRLADDSQGAFSDWARSGYGGGCCGGCYDGGKATELFSETTLLALLAGAGLAFYILYTAVTAAAAAAGGGKRKRRNVAAAADPEDVLDFEDILFHGRLSM